MSQKSSDKETNLQNTATVIFDRDRRVEWRMMERCVLKSAKNLHENANEPPSLQSVAKTLMPLESNNVVANNITMNDANTETARSSINTIVELK